MTSLYSIVYVSTAVSLLSDQALETLLADARQRNAQAGVTGVLLYSGGAFFQYLEGEQDALLAVYAHIRSSRSHHAIYELWRAPIAERAFPQWLMGMAHASNSEVLALSQARWQCAAGDLAAQDQPRHNPGLILLQAFWRENARLA